MVNKLSLPATDNEVQTKVNEVVDDINTNVVHKTGDETIGGMKTFIRGTAGIRISRGSTAYTEIMTTKGDANYTRTGGFRNIEDNSINESLMYVTNDDGSDISGKISVLRNTTTGDVYTKAPTPTTADNSDKIATTSFVKSQGYITSSALTDKADTDLSNINNLGKILVSGLSMPSSKYDDLTLGVSGATYSAPANGWFVFARASSANNQFNSIINVSAGGLRCDSYATSSGKWTTVFMPAKKGDTIQIEYNTSTDKLFRFIYAEGENV